MTAAQRLANLWLLVIAVSTVVAIGAAALADGTALTVIPLLWFLAVCPGLPYAQLLRLDDVMQQWLIAVGLSVAIGAIVAETLLYLHLYSAVTTVVVIGVIACVGAVIGRLRVRGDADADETSADDVRPIELTQH